MSPRFFIFRSSYFLSIRYNPHRRWQTNQVEAKLALKAGCGFVVPPLNHSTRVRPRRNGRAGICATRSKAPAVPRSDTDHTGPSISHRHRCKIARASASRRFRAPELTGALRPCGSAHFGPGLAMDTNCSIDTRDETIAFFHPSPRGRVDGEMGPLLQQPDRVSRLA